MKSETVRYVALVLIVALAVFFLLRINDNKVGQYQIASTSRAFAIIDTRTGEIVQSVGLASQASLPVEPDNPDPMMHFIDYMTNTLRADVPLKIVVSGSIGIDSGIYVPDFPRFISVDIVGD